MAQKSLSLLHKIDSSMIWTSYIYEKKYKWLSYNLWFFYLFFFKNIFFIKLSNNNEFQRNYFKEFNTFIRKNKSNYIKIDESAPRFSYYIDLYCIEFFNIIILLNLYFQTKIEFYKKKNKFDEIIKEEDLNDEKVLNCFF